MKTFTSYFVGATVLGCAIYLAGCGSSSNTPTATAAPPKKLTQVQQQTINKKFLDEDAKPDKGQ